ncbi:MAG: hypothetical protein O7B30_00655 [Thaumarchaeota archaeon]|nr:hypothetical protein [Nitrososphaerota archaeon]
MVFKLVKVKVIAAAGCGLSEAGGRGPTGSAERRKMTAMRAPKETTTTIGINLLIPNEFIILIYCR